MRQHPLLFLPVLLAAFALPSPAGALDGRVAMVLEGGVFQRRLHEGKLIQNPPVPLELDTSCSDGRWGSVIGMAPRFNRGHHRGRVLEVQVTGGGVQMVVEMNIASDPWIQGGRGLYTIKLAWADTSSLKGTFTGEFGAGHWGAAPVSGKATAIVSPPPKAPEGFVPFQPGEHPRVLFRKADIPGIQARIPKSPVTQAAWERVRTSGHMICLGVMYQFTGDRNFAERAKPLVFQRMKERGAGAFSTGHVWGDRLADTAYSYDLCGDTWDEDFLEYVIHYIEWTTERLIYRPNSVSRKVNWSPCSNYHNFLRGGAAIGASVLTTDKGTEPQPPRDPGMKALDVPAVAGFQPGKGVPVLDYGSGRKLTEWVLAGPFHDPNNSGDDYLEHLGGEAKAHGRLALGQEIRWKANKAPFEPLARKGDFFWDERVVLTEIYRRNFPEKSDGYYSTGYFFTVLRNDADRLVQFGTGASGGTWLRVWLSGRPVEDLDYVQLGKGLHPILIRVRIGETSSWGKLWMEPRFTDTTHDDAMQDLARRQVLYKLAHAEWQEDLASWKANGGANPNWTYLAGLARYHMAQNYRYLMGDGGWQIEGEGYTLYSIPLPLEYAAAHLKLYGTDVTGRPDVNHFPCRYVATTVFGHEKRPVSQSFSLASGTMHSGHYARVFPVVPEEYQPAVLWAWNQTLGLTPNGKGTPKFHDDLDALFTVLHYPIGMEAKNPGECMPRVWVASTKGGYVFRNEWKDKNDIVAQIGLKSEGSGGWSHPDGASIRLVGLGHTWADQGVGNSKAGSRWFENVVMLPDDPIEDGEGAFVRHFEAKPDGSGSLSADMNAIYMGQPEKKDLPEGRSPEPRDLGIRGTRSFAVDYSGRSGAPALLVVADHITGGGRKIWMWQLPKDDRAKTSMDGRSFTIAQGDTSLRATFLAPADPKLEIITEKRRIHLKYGTYGDVALRAVHVTSASNQKMGDFVVALTLQRGEAPRVEGSPMAFTVGGQKVRLDGEKIVVER